MLCVCTSMNYKYDLNKLMKLSADEDIFINTCRRSWHYHRIWIIGIKHATEKIETEMWIVNQYDWKLNRVAYIISAQE